MRSRNPDTGAYERTLDSAATWVQFGTLPNVQLRGEVLPNVLEAAGRRIPDRDDDPDNNTGPNALASVGDLANGNIGDVLSGLSGAADDALADVQNHRGPNGGFGVAEPCTRGHSRRSRHR